MPYSASAASPRNETTAVTFIIASVVTLSFVVFPIFAIVLYSIVLPL